MVMDINRRLPLLSRLKPYSEGEAKRWSYPKLKD